MNATQLLSDKNIPEALQIGKGTLTVLRCKNKSIYQKIEENFRGSIFHLEYKGEFYVKVDSGILKMLKPYIEQ